MAAAPTSCHFDWNLEPDKSKDSESVIATVNTILKDDPGFWTVPALLFRAFLYMSDYSRTPNTTEANKSLKDAENEIAKLNIGAAQIGYRIVHRSLASVIEGKLVHDDDEEEALKQKVSELQEQSTTESKAYIDVTKAFALARLGPSRLADCVDCFKSAADGCKDKNDKAELLVYHGIYISRFTRFKEGIPKDETYYTKQERSMYEEALANNPDHILANLFYGEVLYHEDKLDKATKYFEKALKLGPQNMKVLAHVTRFYRHRRYWKKAYSCAQKALNMTKQDKIPDPMLNHQLSLIYLEIYKIRKNTKCRIEKGSEQYVEKLQEETDPKSLLQLAMEAIDAAILLDDCVVFHTSRALIYTKMGKEDTDEERRKEYIENARKEYKLTMSRIHDALPENNIKIFVRYGLFLLSYDQDKHKAMRCLKKGIETAVTKCTVYMTNAANIPEPRFQGNVVWYCKKAIVAFQSYNLSQLKENGVDVVALKNLGWLVHLVGDYHTEMKKNKSALQYYRKALENCHEHDKESRKEILQGLIDCHLKWGQDADFTSVRDYVEQLKKIDTDAGRIKTADWKLAEGRHALATEDFPRARSLFLEAVDVGSFEACRHMITRMIDSNPSWATMWRFREDCARIIHCLEDRDGILSMTRKMAGLSLHNVTEDERNVESAAKEDAIKMVNDALKIDDERFRNTRSAHFDLEMTLLNKMDKDVAKKCISVFANAKRKLEFAVREFGKKYYNRTSERTKKKYWIYPCIKQGHAQISVDNELQTRLETQARWVDFKKKFPDLHRFLVEVQPASNPAKYKWVSAMANVRDAHEHPDKEDVNRLDQELEIGKHPDGTKMMETFNLVELARNTSEGFEEIVNEFYKYM